MGSIIYYIGVISSLYLLARLSQHLYTFLHPSSLPRYLHSKGRGGSWALVTGATDGIGLGFAQELCGHGFNVILHGRNRQKLLDVQEQLRREYPASKTRTVVFDARKNDSLDEMIHEFGGRRDGEVIDDDEAVNLTVLINNVGGMRCFPPDYPPYPELDDYTSSQLDSIMNLNARFAAQLTRLLLPTLIRNGPSLIMNLSSAAATGVPYTPVYGGAKGFIESFTKCVNTEMVMRKKDVEVLGIKLSNVKSATNNVAVGFRSPTSRRMARAALGRVGCGKVVVWGYWPHALQGMIIDFLHERIFQKAVIGAMAKRMGKEELEKKKT